MEPTIDATIELALPERQQHRPAVGADVQKSPNRSVWLTDHGNRVATRMCSEVITGLCNLRLVT